MQDRPAQPNTLPQHPQRLPPPKPTLRQRIMGPIGTLMFLGFLVWLVVYAAPVLLSDWRVQGAAQPVSHSQVQDGSCTTNVIFAVCDMTLRAATPNGVVSRTVNYIFIDLGLGDLRVQVMADPAHPDLLTSDLGLDRLGNRTITLLAGIALSACLPVLWLRARLRRWQATKLGTAR